MIIHAPESVGMSSARLQRLDENFKRRIDAGEFAGVATCVARKGKVVHFHVQGMADREKGKPLAEDTIYRIYSMSKPITAAALLTLFEEGRFQLDDPVSAFIPEFSFLKVFTRMTEEGPEVEDLQRPVTFRHLFTHTSGICNPNEKGTEVEKLMAKAAGTASVAETTMSLAQAASLITRIPLAHQPGAGWTYGLSTDVLGRLIEIVSGEPLDVFFQNRLFEPLGMMDAGFFAPVPKHGRLAAVYGKNAQGVLARVPEAADAYGKKPAFLSGGAGLVCTAEDYLRFARMLLNGGELDGVRILGRRTVKLMASNHIPQLMDLPAIRNGTAFGLGCAYGLGGKVIMEEYPGLYGSAGTYSWDGLAGTAFFVDPKEELTALFMTQIMPWPPAMTEQFKTLVYQSLI